MKLSKEAIVGLFTLAIGVVLFWATFYLGKLDVLLQGGETYSAVLESAHGCGFADRGRRGLGGLPTLRSCVAVPKH